MRCPAVLMLGLLAASTAMAQAGREGRHPLAGVLAVRATVETDSPGGRRQCPR